MLTDLCPPSPYGDLGTLQTVSKGRVHCPVVQCLNITVSYTLSGFLVVKGERVNPIAVRPSLPEAKYFKRRGEYKFIFTGTGMQYENIYHSSLVMKSHVLLILL